MNYQEFAKHFAGNDKTCQIDAEQFERLARFMPWQEMLDAGLNARHLTQLSYHHFEMYSLDVEALLTLIAHNSYVQSLNLNVRGEISLLAGQLLRANTMLRSLKLRHNCLSNDFILSLTTHPTITDCDIEGHGHIPATEAVLMRNQVFTSLSVGVLFHFTNDMMRSLAVNTTLRKLNINDDNAFRIDCNLLCKNTTLQDLYYYTLGDQENGCVLLSMPLQKLTLRNASINLNMFLNQPTIVTLDISYNIHVNDDFFIGLLTMPLLRHLLAAHLKISNNAIQLVIAKDQLCTLDVSLIPLDLKTLEMIAGSKLKKAMVSDVAPEAASYFIDNTLLESLAFESRTLTAKNARIFTQNKHLTYLELDATGWNNLDDASETLATCRVPSVKLHFKSPPAQVGFFGGFARNKVVKDLFAQFPSRFPLFDNASLSRLLAPNQSLTSVVIADNNLKFFFDYDLNARLYQNRFYKAVMYETLQAIAPLIVQHGLSPFVLAWVFEFVFDRGMELRDIRNIERFDKSYRQLSSRKISSP